MKEELITLLTTLGYPIFQQGSMLDTEQYPSSFFTFWNYESPDINFYDNNSNRAKFSYFIYFYSDNPNLVDCELLKAKKILKTHGWVVVGNGEDVASDEPTHTGRMMPITKLICMEE